MVPGKQLLVVLQAITVACLFHFAEDSILCKAGDCFHFSDFEPFVKDFPLVRCQRKTALTIKIQVDDKVNEKAIQKVNESLVRQAVANEKANKHIHSVKDKQRYFIPWLVLDRKHDYEAGGVVCVFVKIQQGQGKGREEQVDRVSAQEEYPDRKVYGAEHRPDDLVHLEPGNLNLE